MVADAGGVYEPRTSSGVSVGGVAIDETAIAREMQHHPAPDQQGSRMAAVQALVVQALLQREIERRGIVAMPRPQESGEEAAIRVLLDDALIVPELEEADCQRFFEANRDRFRAPDRALVYHILLAAAPADTATRLRVRAQAEELIADIRNHPQRFADLAARHSSCPSRESGGELGWLENGQTTPEFERQVLQLGVGLCELPVESRYGLHVVRVDSVVRGVHLPYEQVRERIATRLEVQVRQRAIQQLLNELSERFGVEGLDDDAH
ncbi:MAG: peptidylprolyl isomerase [Gammaproteobacteria bacterium]|jgi:peptidyl-prolyl cis-trans isomerase C|nr:peptidylprolyl isomerase [Gammaproteobacteria bacterium]MBP6050796.1 peptidylprolyl isomerase [Pseudomonadales bacterium]MBK6584416.1 peptidylprolyl isomerase [Gammaproteobacteria bacterium]MBK7520875.1 peptidylprolyl isomerase [Gammaproteobacteria bacterium]MBK7727880.1 peptidylprolyl isomerase [Gammaproteobacteria bacterium]